MVRVAWVPGWYELDQPFEVGSYGEFALWRIVPDHLRGPERLVLYNTVWHPAEAVIARGKIKAIRHPVLGEVQKVDTRGLDYTDTRGLDYTITLADGSEVLVDAEDQPGKLFGRAGERWTEASAVITDWRFLVDFESLSEPRPA